MARPVRGRRKGGGGVSTGRDMRARWLQRMVRRFCDWLTKASRDRAQRLRDEQQKLADSLPKELGFGIYICARCGERFERGRFRAWAAELATSALMTEKAWPRYSSEPLLHKRETHKCSDSGFGIAEFIGVRVETPNEPQAERRRSAAQPVPGSAAGAPDVTHGAVRSSALLGVAAIGIGGVK